MALELKNYDPALMYGANVGVSVDLTDITDMNGNEVIEIDGVTSAVNFIRVANAATTAAPALTAQGDDTNVGLDITTKATGALTLDSGTTGAVNLGTGAAAKTVTVGNTTGATAVAIKSGSGGTVVTSADDNALTVGANGATNPVLKVDASTASVATGISVTGAAAASGVAVAAVSSGTNENITLDAKGTGYVGVGMASTSGGLRHKASVLASSGNTTLTSAMSGSIMLLDGAATDYALPAIGAGDIGMTFTFVATIIATDQTITAQAADLLTGGVAIINVGATGSDFFAPDVTDDLIITLNGTTTGGVAVGSWIRCTAISATRWFVEGVLCGSGTVTTPFS